MNAQISGTAVGQRSQLVWPETHYCTSRSAHIWPEKNEKGNEHSKWHTAQHTLTSCICSSTGTETRNKTAITGLNGRELSRRANTHINSLNKWIINMNEKQENIKDLEKKNNNYKMTIITVFVLLSLMWESEWNNSVRWRRQEVTMKAER